MVPNQNRKSFIFLGIALLQPHRGHVQVAPEQRSELWEARRHYLIWRCFSEARILGASLSSVMTTWYYGRAIRHRATTQRCQFGDFASGFLRPDIGDFLRFSQIFFVIERRASDETSLFFLKNAFFSNSTIFSNKKMMISKRIFQTVNWQHCWGFNLLALNDVLNFAFFERLLLEQSFVRSVQMTPTLFANRTIEWRAQFHTKR